MRSRCRRARPCGSRPSAVAGPTPRRPSGRASPPRRPTPAPRSSTCVESKAARASAGWLFGGGLQRQSVPQAAPSGRPAPANRARFSTDEVHLVFLELKRLRVIGVHLEDEGAPHLLGRGGLARGRRGRCCGPLHGTRARGAVLAEHHVQAVPVCTRVVSEMVSRDTPIFCLLWASGTRALPSARHTTAAPRRSEMQDVSRICLPYLTRAF